MFNALATIDEWGHRHLSWRMHKLIFGLLCDWLDVKWLGITWRELRAQKIPSWRDACGKHS